MSANLNDDYANICEISNLICDPKCTRKKNVQRVDIQNIPANKVFAHVSLRAKN